jgi:hypothetical protein
MKSGLATLRVKDGVTRYDHINVSPAAKPHEDL